MCIYYIPQTYTIEKKKGKKSVVIECYRSLVTRKKETAEGVGKKSREGDGEKEEEKGRNIRKMFYIVKLFPYSSHGTGCHVGPRSPQGRCVFGERSSEHHLGSLSPPDHRLSRKETGTLLTRDQP